MAHKRPHDGDPDYWTGPSWQGKDGWMERGMIWMRDARQARNQQRAAEDCP